MSLTIRSTMNNQAAAQGLNDAGKSAERSIAALLKSPYLADRQSCAEQERKEEINTGKE